MVILELFNSNTANILFGGLIGTILTIFLQRSHTKKDDQTSEYNLLTALRCEITGLKGLMNESQKELIQKEFDEENKIINSLFIVNQNYFSFFDQNFGNFHRISSQDLQLNIQRLVLRGKSYLDSISIHNDILNHFVEFGTRYQHTGNAYDLEKAQQYLGMLQEYDLKLSNMAINLQNELNRIEHVLIEHLAKTKQRTFWGNTSFKKSLKID